MPTVQAVKNWTTCLGIFLGTFAGLLTFAAMKADRAPGNLKCGHYKGEGQVQIINDRAYVVIYKGSQNETKLKINGQHTPTAGGLNGQWVEFEGVLKRPATGFRGTIELKDLKIGVPAPLNPDKNMNFYFVTPIDCKPAP